jgi:L-alanine-DL-glutamate epimerase-like enolase superfamily enzyme
MAMKVTEVLAASVVIPLKTPTSFSTRTINDRHYTLVRVRTDTGVEGLGFCYCGNRGGHIVAHAVRDLLAPVVVGRDAHQVEGAWDAMYKDALLMGRRGAVLRAMSAIDTALWDAAAKAAELPLYQYLGAHYQDTVPAYASGGYYLPGKGLDGLAREVAGYVETGLRAVKIKVGRASGREDAARVEAVRKAVGPDVEVMADANNAWNDAATAIRAIRLWEDFDLAWVEEPTMPDELDASAAIARAVRVPIATGEIHQTRWDFLEIIRKEAASIIQPDAGVCGGITEFRRIASLAAAHSIPVAPHWLADLHVHLVAATPNATWVEFFTGTDVLNLMEVFKTRLRVKDGGLTLPQEPGLGVVLDEAAVERFSQDGWR